MSKTAYNPFTSGDVTSLEEVVAAGAVAGHEQNASLKATESMEGYIEAFYSVSRNGGAVGTYEDANSFDLPANAIPTEILYEVTEAKAGSGTLTLKLGGTSVATITAKDVAKHADPGSFRSATASAIEFAVTSDTITAGAVRVRIKYLRGGDNS